MKIKNFLKKCIKKLPSFNKTISFVTCICFFISCIFSQTAYAFTVSPMPVQNINLSSQITKTIVPFNLGKITDALYANDGDIVINIQDLHSHEQTQKNISNILSLLDKKYGLDKVYVEGAVGTVNTKWLGNIKEKNIQEKILNNLLKSGRLTGSEYYAAKSGKNNLLQGIEDREIYIRNLKRLDRIYSLKEEINDYIPYLQHLLEKASEKYYSPENKKTNTIVTSYQNGKIKTGKYIELLLKQAKKANVNLSKYSTITNLAKTVSKQKSFNSQKLNDEITQLLTELKTLMPFKEYKELTDKATKKETESDFYFNLLKKAEQNNLFQKKSFKNAKLFFEYLILNQNINPVDLALKEQLLIQELNEKFSLTENEKNIYFLKKYLSDLSAYLNNKLTARDYEFFSQNSKKFKLLWKNM